VRIVAEAWGLSDVGLKKVCVKADIPVPGRGYWARLKAGERVVRSKLPPRGPGMPDTVTIGEASQGCGRPTDLTAELARPVPMEPVFAETIEALRGRVQGMVGKVRFERDLARGHETIRNLLAGDERRKPRRDERARSWAEPPRFQSAFEQRRFRVLNSLFLAAGKLGAHAGIDDLAARSLHLRVGVATVRFRLDHPDAKPDRQGNWKTREGFADLLQLDIEGPGACQFADAEETSLETDLTEMVVSLIVAGELNFRASAFESFSCALRRREELKDQVRVARAEAEENARLALVAAEAARRDQLLAMATDLRAADDIRALVARALAVQGCGQTAGPDDDRWRRWSAWAMGVADRLDPVRRLGVDMAEHATLRPARLSEPAVDALEGGSNA
jgi:hypothetical protein